MPARPEHIAESLDANGFVHVSNLINQQYLIALVQSLEELDKTHSAAGVRDLAAKSFTVRGIATSQTIRRLVESLLGHEARLVRSIYFKKTIAANWGVSWHQDLSIAVRAQKDVPGYTGWSVKDGITHVQPPDLVLERMVALRIHLDTTDESNGALLVSPGSHKMGRIPAKDAASVANKLGRHTCAAAAGDAILMRPLILHASHKSKSQEPRRIIHLEFAGTELAAPLEWNEAA